MMMTKEEMMKAMAVVSMECDGCSHNWDGSTFQCPDCGECHRNFTPAVEETLVPLSKSEINDYIAVKTEGDEPKDPSTYMTEEDFVEFVHSEEAWEGASDIFFFTDKGGDDLKEEWTVAWSLRSVLENAFKNSGNVLVEKGWQDGMGYYSPIVVDDPAHYEADVVENDNLPF